MAPHRVDPSVDGEALEEHDPASVEHCLHDAEDPADVNQRSVDDDDALTQPQVVVAGLLVVLRAAHHQFERLVAEVDPLGRSGRAAGQHANGDAGRRLERAVADRSGA